MTTLAPPMANPTTCRHTERDRGACRACGRVFTDPKPNRDPLSWKAEREAERGTYADVIREQRGIIEGLIDAVVVLRVIGEWERGRDDVEGWRASAAEAWARALEAEAAIGGVCVRLLRERVRMHRAEVRLAAVREAVGEAEKVCGRERVTRGEVRAALARVRVAMGGVGE